MDLNTELVKIDGIGSKFIPKLAKLNIKTVRDLLWHFPFGMRTILKLSQLESWP